VHADARRVAAGAPGVPGAAGHPHRLAEQPRLLVDLILAVVALPLTRRACHDSLRGIAS